MKTWLTFVLGLLFFVPALEAQDAAPKPEAPSTLRICILGASVSAGFGSNYNLSEVIGAALGDSAEVVNAADTAFFLDEEGKGKEQVDQAIASKASLVIGIDYLFWFAAGKKTAEERLKGIDLGFAELDRLKSTVLIGLIPHMRKVSKRMLPESRQIPAEQIPVINDHIKELVQSRKNFRVVPVDAWMDAIEDGTELEAFERMGAKAESRDHYMLPDGLHLNREGIIFAAALLIDDMSQKELVGQTFSHRIDSIQKALAASERSITIDVFDADSGAVTSGVIRFSLPTIAELVTAGLTFDDLTKLKDLQRYSKPLPFEGSNRIELKHIPAAASRIQFQVRAEVGTEQISSWSKINLERIEARTILVLRKVEPLRVKVLAGENANALAGALVIAKEEVKGRGLQPTALEGSGPGYGTTDAEGIATLDAVGPDIKNLLVRDLEGRVHELPCPKGEGLLLLRILETESTDEPVTDEKNP